VLDPVAAEEYRSGKAGVTIGDVHIHIPANAAPQRPEDWSAIVRNQIVPELKRIEFLKR
jgi:hypothetical protein